MMKYRFSLFVFCCLLVSLPSFAEDGYRLWLRYDPIADQAVRTRYQAALKNVLMEGDSPTLVAAREELMEGLRGLLDTNVPFNPAVQDGTLLVGTLQTLAPVGELNLEKPLRQVGDEGYLIFTTKLKRRNVTVVAANTDVGVLYGCFHLLRLLQTHQPLQNLNLQETPKLDLRVLNHWDNLDRSVERGYAGASLWKWHLLPDYLDPRYREYARANASVGINGTVLNNVNANALILTEEFLPRVAALANVFRPYGIKVYLSARFSAPIEIGGLKTADPLDPQVQQWWKKKVDEIYGYIPDFGGFLVKANSEGQPGPQNYNRSHAEGANLLADALAPHGGVVMWRAFVYSNEEPEDRAKQAYNEFVPLDGKFRDNVLVQVKNGAIDFQPREPFHPLFGAMPNTPLMMEFQITQEYTGQSTNLFYQMPLYKETLDADTYAKGKGSTVAKVVDGTLEGHRLTGVAGVSNIGDDRNWTGHPFAQSNWYGYGRLAWDHALTSEQIADEWLRMTFSNDEAFVKPVSDMMIASREIVVDYMTPLGLHHLMGWSHHYGPGPWVTDKPRADWTATYYHQADSNGIGFDRTKTGSDALAQYFPPVQEQWGDPKTCPEEFLLWFHHLPWDYTTKSGRSLWDELCHRYYAGADSVAWMQDVWQQQKSKVDADRFQHVATLLDIQKKEAIWWRNACVLYFQQFSRRPIPDGLEKPDRPLSYYESLEFHARPGN
ncbi:alpha-glucuronidase [Catalinimonas alkaloidigena]|uniref:Xylan alpha-1,2-glucuronidase n=1 Tax=Catalinimonas alkaloidigena TaxID=1075417 RepID=A0A1G9HBG2_9BACT|nr:alpha-glucuronidase family glycosyl hydrolase [Catalinimonas alkaloidigena]SDL10358.1 alpha-glucuronidase [Catalinimonas alkaloidigena]